MKTVIHPVKNKYGISYKAEVKDVDYRVTIGTFPSRESAMEAASLFLATGVKPPRTRAKPVSSPKARRAAKPKPKPVVAVSGNPDRLAMIARIARSLA